MTDLQRLLSHLYRGGQWGYYWTMSEATVERTSRDGKTYQSREELTTWFRTDKIPDRLPRDTGNQGPRHIYFGVNPTAAIPDRVDKDGRKKTSRFIRAKIEDIAAINCLFGDFDDKSLSDIEQFSPPPSVIVQSSVGKYQAYWLLDEPVVFASPEERQYANKVQAAWRVFVDSDRGAKDIARVLRCPGSRNVKAKYGPDYPECQFIRYDATLYRFTDLVALCEPFIATTTSTANGTTDSTANTRDIARQKLSYALHRTRTAPDGQKHAVVRDMAILVGGYLHYDAYSETDAINALYDAISHRADDASQARKTIEWGVEQGKDKPLLIEERTTDSDAGAKPTSSTTPTETPPAGDDPSHRTEYRTNWTPQIISAKDLQVKHFTELTWAVDRILPEGACLLAGKPKSRKSWLALAISIAVATNGRALGHLGVTTGRVLFLDLESNQRRMQARLRAMMERGTWPDNFHVATEWPRGDDGLHQLDLWMETYPDTRLIVIDVLADFRRPRDAKEDPYLYDRETVKPVNEWAEKHRVAVLLIHHTRKAKADDVFDEISGSTGLPSAVATMWVIGRSPEQANEYIFALRGRDVEDDEPLALQWDAYLCAHTILGEAAQYAVTAERRDILDVMASQDKAWSPSEIAGELNKSAVNIKKLLPKLLETGVIEKVGYGKYALIANHSSHSSHSSHSGHSGHSTDTAPGTTPESDRKSERVTGDDPRVTAPHHSCEPHQDAADQCFEGQSDQSDHSLRELQHAIDRGDAATAQRVLVRMAATAEQGLSN